MPTNKKEKRLFAFITVFFTVLTFVFYSLYVVEGKAMMNATGTNSVLAAINKQGGVYMCAHFVPVWAMILTEIVIAFFLAFTVGSPLAFKLAAKKLDPKETDHTLFGTAVVCATAAIMCPAMSFIATFLYYPYYSGFSIIGALAGWFRLVCFNFPFAFFSQVFFRQPLVRAIFKALVVNRREKGLNRFSEVPRRKAHRQRACRRAL